MLTHRPCNEKCVDLYPDPTLYEYALLQIETANVPTLINRRAMRECFIRTAHITPFKKLNKLGEALLIVQGHGFYALFGVLPLVHVSLRP